MLDLALMLLPFVALGIMLGVGCCCDQPQPCYKLTNCENDEEFFYSSSDLAAYLGQVVELDESEFDDAGWLVESVSAENCTDPETVTVVASYEDCESYLCPCYKLTNCEDEFDIIYTNTPLDITKIHKIDGNCYTAVCDRDHCDEAEAVTISSSHDSCEACGLNTTDACGGCITDLTPESVHVVVGTYTGCCTGANGLELLFTNFAETGFGCRADEIVFGPICTGAFALARFEINTLSGDTTFTLTIDFGPGRPTTQWRYTATGTPVNCIDLLNDMNLTPFSNNMPGTCGMSGTSVANAA